MRGELSHGLPALITSGNRILREDTNSPVLLRGVNRSGLEYSEPSAAGFLDAARFSGEEIREIVQGWGANVIRVPFNQDWARRGRNGHSAEEYQSSLDRIVEWTAALGAYTILDLQWLDADTVYGYTVDRDGTRHANHVPPTPSPESILLWRSLASRYRDESAALFDLLNEPHNRLEDDPFPIHVISEGGEVVESDNDRVGPEEWLSWVERLVGEIRSIRPEGLILAGGIDWAFDLRHIRVNAPNMVYSAHIYPNRAPRHWRKALGRAEEVPVFIGEWGGTGDDLEFGKKLAEMLRRRGLGWAAWSWSDHPHLVDAASLRDYRPTGFGELVKEELRT